MTFEGRVSAHQTLRTLLTNFDVEPDRFTRLDLGEEWSFISVEYLVLEILDTVRLVREGPYEKLPEHVARLANSALDAIAGPLTAIINFSVVKLAEKDQNPLTAHKKVVDDLEKASAQFFEQMAQVLVYIVSMQPAPISGGLDLGALSHTTALDEAAKLAQQRVRELDEVVAASREAAGKVGVAHHAAHFAAEATRYSKISSRWLIATTVGALLTLCAGAINYKLVVVDTAAVDTGHAIQLVLAKLIVFSLLISGTIWCGKNYRASQHNLVVNRHRQNALSSFQTFAEAATDPQTKNAVLLQATQSIFSPQHTGYVSNEAESSGAPQIVEMVRSVTGSDKG